MNENEKRTDIALFRYALIAPVIQENVGVQAEYFREISQKYYDVPHLGKKRFKAGTLKFWLKQYRRYGFDALKPKTREDKGASRKITGDLALAVKETVKQYPISSCAAILLPKAISAGERYQKALCAITSRKITSNSRTRPSPGKSSSMNM